MVSLGFRTVLTILKSVASGYDDQIKPSWLCVNHLLYPSYHQMVSLEECGE